MRPYLPPASPTLAALTALSALLLLAACGPAPTPSGDTTGGGAGAGEGGLRDPAAEGLPVLRLQTDWVAQPEHGGYYQAIVEGYFREAGLDVRLTEGGPGVRPYQVLALGGADLCFGRSDETLRLAADGNPVVIVTAMMQHDPQGFMVHESSSVRTVADFAGKTVMATPGAEYLELIRRRHRIEFTVVPSDYGMAAFAADTELVKQCFVTNEPYYAAERGLPVRVLPIAATGYDAYRVILADRALVAARADDLRKFIAASVRGWREFLHGDRTRATDYILRANRNITPGFVEFSVAKMKEYRIVEGDPAKGERLGALDPARLDAQMRLLVELGSLPREVPLAAYVAQELQ